MMPRSAQGSSIVVVVVVLVDVVDSVIVTFPGPTGGLDSQPMDSAASRQAVSSRTSHTTTSSRCRPRESPWREDRCS